MRARLIVGVLALVVVSGTLVALFLRDCTGAPSPSDRPATPISESTSDAAHVAPRPSEAGERTVPDGLSVVDGRDHQPASGGTVRGVVVEDGTESPVSGATVRVVSPRAASDAGRTATTAADGRFEVRGVAQGEGVLLVAKSGWWQPGIDLDGLRSMAEAFGSARNKACPDADPGEGRRIFIAKQGDVVERRVTLARAEIVRGRVTNAAGAPVAGAEVTVQISDIGNPLGPQDAADPLRGSAQVMGRTDADGRFELPSPAAPSDVRVVVKAKGMALMLVAPSDPGLETGLALEPGGRLEGRISDSAGSPIAGATLRLFPVSPLGVDACPDLEFWAALEATSSSDGTFAVDSLPVGSVNITCQHPRFVIAYRSDVAVAAGATARADLTMERGLTIAGRVVRDDGKPLGNLAVSVETSDEPIELLGPLDGRFTPDSDGLFHVDCLRAAKYRLMVVGIENGTSEPLVVEAGAIGVVLRVQASINEPLLAITGTLRLAGGETVTAAHVTADRVESNKSRLYYGDAVTGGDGSFRIDKLPAGTYALKVSPYTTSSAMMEGQTRPNIRVKQVVDVVAGTADLVIEVERGLTVTGRVRTQDGSPATDGVVNVYYVATGGKDAMDASEQRSDQFCVSSKVDNGRFEVIGLDPRKVRLSVDARGWLRRTITVDAGAKDILFELIRGGFITGRVLMPDGTPATRAWVRIEDEGDDSDRPRGTRSEADGTFKLNDVTPGVHRVVASCDDDKGNVSVQGDARGIEVQSEKTADGVEIRTRRLP